jgi:RND superfamily putative drug exporter
MVSGVPFFTQIGFAVTVGIALVSFVVSLLLVPAITALLGRAAWWPGRPATAVSEFEIEKTGQARAGSPTGR